ncbi:MAG: hypothetical protein CO124_00420 [Candidatus Huberarchaeum crystalense]|uniref:Uncharacterized protein n=1 Tax=Huberarchaeum crystalense TaxID=2014257 RepID=A0A2H9QSR0_HUBC1|nr:MAG: hypothetical protein CO124_00420 [Candidatus Huberarchaeum crystalense]
MTATPYKIYVVFENTAVEGEYIPLLYTASDVVGANAVLPSDSDIYTLPTGTSTGEQKVYRLREVIVIGTFTDTTCANIWANDLKTEHLIIHDINTKDTVDRQFKVIKLFFNGGTSIRLKLGA